MLRAMAKPLNIAVVGGGVAGCAAALMLRRDGHAVTLFEQTPRIGPVGAGILVQPSGQAVLAELGLLDEVAARSSPIDRLVAHTHRGRLLSNLVYADYGPGYHALGVHRADLFGAIHAAMAGAGVTVRLGHRIDAAPLHGRTRRLTTDGRSVGDFDLVLAADGSRSRLRKGSGLRAFVHDYTPAALWAVGYADVGRQLVQVTRGARELCGLLPMGSGRCSFFWGIDSPEWLVQKTRSFPAWRDRVLRLAPQAKPVFDTLTDWSHLLFSSYRAVVMPRVCASRLAFLGDAAHAAGPHLGQGANLALVDAAALRNCLRARPAVDDALAAYNTGQRWRNAWYSLATAALMPSFQGRLFGLGAARDLVLPRLQRVPPVRRLMLKTLCGV